MKYFLMVSVLFTGLFAGAQSPSRILDSLHNLIKNAKHDTTKAAALVQISEEIFLTETYTVIPICEEAIAITDKNFQRASSAEKRSFLKTKSSALNNLGAVYYNKGDMHKALSFYDRSLKISEELEDNESIASTLNNIGQVYSSQGDYPAALRYFGKCLNIKQEDGSIGGISSAYNNIGSIYTQLDSFPKALENYDKALILSEKNDNKPGVATALNNIAACYFKTGNMEQTVIYCLKSLSIRKEFGDMAGIANSFNSLGMIHLKQALKTKTAADKQKRLKLAKRYCDSSLLLSKKLGFPEYIERTERVLMRIDSVSGNFEGALSHFKQYISYRDSVTNTENRKASYQSQLNFEFQKKEAVMNEQRERERALSQEKDRRQQLIIISAALGLMLVAGFAFFVYRSLKTTTHQKSIIEQKQKDILDSIHYARRIQSSLLPSENYIGKTLKRLKKT